MGLQVLQRTLDVGMLQDAKGRAICLRDEPSDREEPQGGSGTLKWFMSLMGETQPEVSPSTRRSGDRRRHELPLRLDVWNQLLGVPRSVVGLAGWIARGKCDLGAVDGGLRRRSRFHGNLGPSLVAFSLAQPPPAAGFPCRLSARDSRRRRSNEPLVRLPVLRWEHRQLRDRLADQPESARGAWPFAAGRDSTCLSRERRGNVVAGPANPPPAAAADELRSQR